MHPVLSNLRALVWYGLAWVLGGLGLASALVLQTTTPWRNALWFAIPVCVAYGFVIPSAYYLCRAMPFSRRRLALGLMLFGAASATAGAVAWVLSQAWNHLSLALEMDGAGVVFTPGLELALFVAAAGVYLLSLLVHDTLIALDQVREAQRRAQQSHLLAQEAELQMLRTQVNPHFLFNCLNSISALTSTDAAGARSMTIALAQYFRQTLALSEQSRITLAQEVEHCTCFLDIEAQRFGAKLAVSIALEDGADQAQVPPMILQPLVENAVKHGVAHSLSGGTVSIHAVVRCDWLHVTVENPLEAQNVAIPSAASASASVIGPQLGLGLGLRNSQQRLRAVYGDQARIVQRVSAGRFVVELTLPFSTQETGLTSAVGP